MQKRPTNYLITSGTGEDYFELVSFDKALFQSRVANYNLVRVSSILPPGCNEKKEIDINEGSILYTAYSHICSNEEGVISAAIAVAIPYAADNIGVIMEYSCFQPKEYAIEQVIRMVKESMKVRRIQIKEIKYTAAETFAHAGSFSSAFAAIAMW